MINFESQCQEDINVNDLAMSRSLIVSGRVLAEVEVGQQDGQLSFCSLSIV